MEDPDSAEACLDMPGELRIAATAKARMSVSVLGVEGGVGKRFTLQEAKSALCMGVVDPMTGLR